MRKGDNIFRLLVCIYWWSQSSLFHSVDQMVWVTWLAMCCWGMKGDISVQALPITKVITKIGRREEQKWQKEHYSSVVVGFLFEKHPSEGRLLQKVFGHYLWYVRCCSLSLLFPKEVDVMCTTPFLSSPLPVPVSEPSAPLTTFQGRWVETTSTLHTLDNNLCPVPGQHRNKSCLPGSGQTIGPLEIDMIFRSNSVQSACFQSVNWGTE